MAHLKLKTKFKSKLFFLRHCTCKYVINMNLLKTQVKLERAVQNAFAFFKSLFVIIFTLK